MPKANYRILALSLSAGGALLLLAIWFLRFEAPVTPPATAKPAEQPRASTVPPRSLGAEKAGLILARNQRAAELKAQLRDLIGKSGARPGEAELQFRSEQAYRDFLARAERAGLRILSRIDALRSVRIATGNYDPLVADWLEHASDYGEVSANFLVTAPNPSPEAQARAARSAVPLGNNLLPFLGARGDISQWGRGVTIAVIDSGIQPDMTFGAGRLQFLDVGRGTVSSPDPDGGHGTAVAALAGGASPDAQGVAPAAQLLSIRVGDDTGKSDIFTVAQAIVAAVDGGAQIVNISMGSYGVSDVLKSAIGYAADRGVVIVAAAGNDQAAQLMWPAADPRVVSVGAVDALQQQVIFSNSGPQLQITAPGYGVQTAWTDGGRVLMDGTSASAPIIAGSIAALMSTNPGMSATEAWQVLQKYADDGGPMGADPDYGHGVVDLGWAMARNDISRVDTAVAGYAYNDQAHTMDVVVQNRSGSGVGGMTLDVAVNGTANPYPISWLNAGEEQVIHIPVDPAQFTAPGGLRFDTQLNNPSGALDQVPANNRRRSVFAPPAAAAPSAPPSS